MKKLINDPADVVSEALRGVAAAHPQLRVDHENKVVFRADAPVQGKVGIVSGGGSGHEPLQGGFVGPGGLDAACAGEVFTSPVPDQMLAATKGVDGGAGVLHVVLNYTGDVMNFEMAAELADAEGVQVETVIMNDDVAVEDSLYTAGRRGVAATILLNKIVGAAADEGRDLAAVAEVSRKVIGNARSMGMALTSCTVPAAGRPTFDLPDDEMEVGIGVHGEPGRRRLPVAPAREIAEMLTEPIRDTPPRDGLLLRLFFGRTLGRERCRALLRAARDEATAKLAEYESLHTQLSAAEAGTPDWPFIELTVRAGIHGARSTVAWADESLAALDGESS